MNDDKVMRTWKMEVSGPRKIARPIRLIHEFSITGSIARQPLLMADQACNCWFFFISNKFNGLIFIMEYAI